MSVLSSLRTSIANAIAPTQSNSFSGTEQKGIQMMESIGFELIHNGLESVDMERYMISKRSFFDIHKSNVTITSYYDKIVKMVAKYGLRVVDHERNMIANQERFLPAIYDFFKIPTFDVFKQQLYTQAFCNGQIFGIVGKVNMLGEMKAKILDGRAIQIYVDKYGDPIEYRYNQKEVFKEDEIVDNIVYYNHDKSFEGLSLYNGLVRDALTDQEASKTNYYFFRNGARPDLFVVMEQAVLNSSEEMKIFKEKWDHKFKGSQKINKPFIGSGVKDIVHIPRNENHLEVIGLRKFSDTRIAMRFGIDKRLIGYDKESGGSRAEIDSVSQINGNTKIREYGEILEYFTTEMVNKFLFPNGEFAGLQIMAVNDEFVDPFKEKKIAMDEIDRGIISRKEYRKNFDIDTIDGEELPEEMGGYYIGKPLKQIDKSDDETEKEEDNTERE